MSFDEFYERFDALSDEVKAEITCSAVSAYMKKRGICYMEDPQEYADNLEFDCPERENEIAAYRAAKYVFTTDNGNVMNSVPCENADQVISLATEWTERAIGKEFTLFDLYKICTENSSVVSLLKSVKPDFFDGQ